MPKSKYSTTIDKKTGKEYYITWLDLPKGADGKRRRKSVQTLKSLTEKEHEKHLAIVKAELEKANPPEETEQQETETNTKTLNEYFDFWIRIKEQHAEFYTVRDYKNWYSTYIRNQIGSISMDKITTSDVKRYVIDGKPKSKNIDSLWGVDNIIREYKDSAKHGDKATIEKILKDKFPYLDEEQKEKFNKAIETVKVEDCAPPPGQAIRAVNLLKSIYKYANKRGDCERTLAWDILIEEIEINEIDKETGTKKKKRKHNKDMNSNVLNEEEQKIVETCIAYDLFPLQSDRMYVMLLLHYGLRREEACGLRREDFHFNEDVPYFSVKRAIFWKNNRPGTKGPKSMKGRRDMPIRDCDIELLKAYTADHPILFTDESGKDYIWESTIRSHWKYEIASTIKHEAKFEGIEFEKMHTMHSFRHTFGTNLDKLGLSENARKCLMGDNSSVVNTVYVHRSNTEVATVTALNSLTVAPASR